MTASPEFLSEYSPYIGMDSVQIANGTKLSISYIGQSSLVRGNRLFHLKNVLCVPSMHHSLLSIRKFSHDNNCYFELNEFGFRVKDRQMRRTVLSGNSSGGLYHLEFQSLPKINPLALISE